MDDNCLFNITLKMFALLVMKFRSRDEFVRVAESLIESGSCHLTFESKDEFLKHADKMKKYIDKLPPRLMNKLYKIKGYHIVKYHGKWALEAD